ncbi:MAG: class I SAM-dependent methyltransferase [Candidatus Nealsonbacteria bacterium]|nr:class I SAM-dependent methyltransferase [Candidatus Nealsonbacteria bacterium]
MNNSEPKRLNSQPATYDEVLGLLPEDRATRILDVGAGEGFFSRRLMDLGYRVEACDVSPDGFKCADVPFRQVDLNGPIPIADNEYDCVVSIEVIEHVENHFQFVRELIRITKPGGRIIVTTPNVLSFTARWYQFLYGYSDCAPLPIDPAQEEVFMEHINPISLPQMLFLFERYGAEMEVLATNRFRKSSLLATLLLYPLLAVAIRLRLLRRKHKDVHALHRRHIRWMLRPANLLGRITIVMAQKRQPTERAGQRPAAA